MAAPSAPTGVTATAGASQVTLAWTAVTGALWYNIYRATVAGQEGTVAIAVGVTLTSYTDFPLSDGTTYYYVVQAQNAAGTSANSSEVSATPQGSAPVAVTGLTATAGGGQVTLRWNGSATGATSYNVYRSTTSGGETLLASGIIGTSYTDTAVTNGTPYFYEVAAVDGTGCPPPPSQPLTALTGPLSAEVSATPQAPPSAPTGVTATAGTAQITLAWTAVPGATNYAIYRSTTSGAEAVSPLTSVGGTSYVDTAVTSTTYYYKIAAVGNYGASALSAEVSAVG